MAVLRLEDATLAFSDIPLLDQISLQIDHGEKVFLVGRNGMGKSCLLKVIMGHYKLDSGRVHIDSEAQVAELPQELPECNNLTVYEYVATGLQELGKLLKRYHELTSTNEITHDDEWMKNIEVTQKKIEQQNGWEYENIINTVLTKLDLESDKKVGALSGGWKRRAALAKALVCKPSLLLLDEPTNHLDVTAIEWLEEFLSNYEGALLCITHDRSLLRKLSKRILELDRGEIFSWDGGYNAFLKNAEHRLEIEARQTKEFNKVLAKEEAWIREGIKARRTRNEGRVRALEKLRRERKERRTLQSGPKFTSNHGVDSGNLVMEATNVNFKHGDNILVKDFSTLIQRGDKIALVGPNGVGKSTLLKLLLGELKPQSGRIRIGTKLQIAYFDQMRAGINFDDNAVNNVAEGRDTITVNGKDKHVISYLGDFLFSAERAMIPVRMLSGGECNRLLLAKLFSLPSNLLILDEPTNDLDIESLELLEEVLTNYKGTVLLVSHDRAFVDQVATSTLVFRGNGYIEEYVGNYSDIPAINTKHKKPLIKPSEKSEPAKVEDKSNLFTSAMKRELNNIPDKIDKLETKIAKLYYTMADPEFYEQPTPEQRVTLQKTSKAEDDLKQLYAKWEKLEQLRSQHKD